MTNYKLSICIPTYNRAKFLPDLLNSIIAQVDNNNPVCWVYRETYKRYKSAKSLELVKNNFN